MLKKILVQSTLKISSDLPKILLTPSKKSAIVLFFENDTEYDMPLSVNLTLPYGVNVDSALFDITVPAFGNTRKTLVFDIKSKERMFFGEAVVEISAIDRVLENKDVFELDIFTEMLYKCDGQSLFSRNGVFYINSGEVITMMLAPAQDMEITLCVLSGSLSDIKLDEKTVEKNFNIALKRGVNALCITSENEASFCFNLKDSDDTAFINTLNF